MGSATYAPEKSAIVWTIKQFQGGKEFILRAHFGLPSVKNGIFFFFNFKLIIYIYILNYYNN